jgi:hypothetical protein
MDKKESSTSGRSETLPKASSVDLVDFSSALSAGLLRAIDARSKVDQERFRPWIWAGFIIGPDGPFGPTGPLGPGGPAGPGGGL